MTPILEKIEEIETLLRETRPGNRNHLDRKFSIILTDLEKLKAYIQQYIEKQNGC